MEIRKASLDDFEALLKVKLELKKEERRFNKTLEPIEKAIKYYQEYLREDLTSKNRAVFVAIENNEIVGMVVGKIFRSLPIAGYKKRGFISNLYVKKGFRKKGVGKRLVEIIINWFKSMNVTSINLELYKNNKVALDIYRKFGFSDYSLKMIKKI